MKTSLKIRKDTEMHCKNDILVMLNAGNLPTTLQYIQSLILVYCSAVVAPCILFVT